LSEYLINGHFYDGLEGWTNDGSGYSPYILDGHTIKGEDSSGIEKKYQINQPFTLVDLAISGTIKVWAKWACPHGYCRFNIFIGKPDQTWHQVCNYIYTDDSGEGYILNNDDILSFLDQQGTYQLILRLYVWADQSWQNNISDGWYDDISILISTKLFKTMKEGFGVGNEKIKEGRGEKEALSYQESYDTKLYIYESFSEAFGLKELAKSLFVKKTVKEGLGFGPENYDTNVSKMHQESEAFKYLESSIKKAFTGKKEGIEFSETNNLKAKLISKESFGFNEWNILIKALYCRAEKIKFIESRIAKAKKVKTEAISFDESYLTKTGRFWGDFEKFAFKESASARLYKGNLIVDYVFPLGQPTPWESSEGQQTDWQDKEAASTDWQDAEKASTDYQDKEKEQTDWQDKEPATGTWRRDGKEEE
jgi:hypothetical protein